MAGIKPITCIFVVNSAAAIETRSTTRSMIAGMQARGHRVLLASVDQLSAETCDRICARAHCVLADGQLGPAELSCMAPGDLVIVRTNPARDVPGPMHQLALELR